MVAPFDPCGAFCDLIRRPYTTRMRPFRDSDAEVDIVWYPCAPGARDLKYPSVVSSLDNWVQERDLGVYSGYSVGEVPGAPRRYNAQKAKPGFTGENPCGTAEMFADGALFGDQHAEPRNAAGLPVCCGGVPQGVVIGGRVEFPPRGSGVLVGGRVEPSSPVIPTGGRVLVGGRSGPPPDDCLRAGELVLERPIAIPYPGSGDVWSNWWRIDGLDPDHVYYVTVGGTETLPFWFLYSGECGSLSTLVDHASNGCEGGFTGVTTLIVNLSSIDSEDGYYSLVVSENPCPAEV